MFSLLHRIEIDKGTKGKTKRPVAAALAASLISTTSFQIFKFEDQVTFLTTKAFRTHYFGKPASRMNSVQKLMFC